MTSPDAVTTPDHRALLARALDTISRLRAELAERDGAAHEPVALVGAGCRLPGGADDPEAFWRLLCDGVDAIGPFPSDRWDAAPYYDPDPDAPAKAYVLDGGFVDGVDAFDARLFGIPPGEALGMDPQQRMALEVAWEALERAGIPPDSLEGSRTGVYLGASTNDYVRMRQQHGDPEAIDAYQIMGEASFIAGRIAHTFGLRGPALVVDTACSSSLVAVHHACQALRGGQIDLALAGGVNAMLSPYGFVLVSKASAVSPDGRCKAFDASANGYGRGEGCGVVVLKRLRDALAAGDDVLAVIRGTALNHDGRASGITVPSGEAQREVVRSALRDAGVEPGAIGYVEAHGTGTALGDPIELRALDAVLGAGRPHDRPVLVGSVKTNIGHLEAAAGIAGLIKAALVVRHGRIPPSLHFRTPNPNVDWAALRLRVPTEPSPWPQEGPRLAGLSSFGASGTNAHVVVEEPPAPRPHGAAADAAGAPAGAGERSADPAAARPVELVTVSAQDEESLYALAGRWAAHLDRHPGLAPADVARTAAAGRAHLRVRAAVTAGTTADLAARLARLARGAGPVPARSLPPHRAKVAFLFTGQGAQYPGMGRELYRTEPVFRRALDACARHLADHLDRPLLGVLFPPDGSTAGTADADGGGNGGDAALHRTRYTQPALFAVEYALAELWRSWGVRPTAVIGHSLGQYTAACVAGVLDLPDALELVAVRARLMERVTQPGAMVAVPLDEREALDAIGGRAAEVSVAAVNGPRATVLSGTEAAVREIAAELAERGVAAKRLRVSHAFHSPLLDPVLPELDKAAAAVRFGTPSVPLVCNVTGRPATAGELAGPGYWSRHAREAVRFHDGMLALAGLGAAACVEVGPGRTLLGLGASSLPEDGPLWAASLRRGAGECAQMLDSLGRLHCLGVPVHWRALHPGTAPGAPLPTYAFRRRPFAFPVASGARAALGGPPPPAPQGADTAPGTGAARTHDLAEELRSAAPGERTARLTGYLCDTLGAALDTDPGEIDPDGDVLALGLDSLLVMGVVKACRRDLGVVVFANQFFERTTVHDWAQLLADVLTGGGTAPDGGGTAARTATPAALDRDVALDPGIRPRGPMGEAYQDPRHVLLTGATGFVGAYLLDDLLAGTRATVHCLVRCADRTEGLARLRANTLRYLPWREDAAERVEVVPGDLGKPLLGLDEDRFDALAHRLDAIYHNGAHVNFNLTYEQLKAVNVGGTQEILRLACRGPLIPVSHVSSYGIWGMPEDGRLVVREDDDIFGAGKLVNGYVQSKWAAERLVRHALDRGIPVDVHRPGRVLGDSRTGACLTTHFTTRIVKGCLQLGLAPELDMRVEMTPVDYVSGALVRASLRPHRFGGTYHLVNSAKLPFAEMLRVMAGYGWRFDVVPLETWWQALKDSYAVSDNVLHPLMDLLEEFVAGGGEEAIDYDAARTEAALEGTGPACRPLDEDLLGLYFDWMVADGYLPAPDR